MLSPIYAFYSSNLCLFVCISDHNLGTTANKQDKTVHFRKIGVVYVRILKNKLFFQCSLCLLSYFLFTFYGENIYLSLNILSIDVYAGKMPIKYIT